MSKSVKKKAKKNKRTAAERRKKLREGFSTAWQIILYVLAGVALVVLVVLAILLIIWMCGG